MICIMPNCDRTAIARDLCTAHYQQRRKSPGWVRKAPEAGDPLMYLLAHMWDGCAAPWPFTKQRGYAFVWDHGKRLGSAHAMVCTIVNGPRPTPRHHARHLCGRGHLGCFHAGCLAWGTAKQNYEDAVRHGTAVIGEAVGTSKLKKEDIPIIRKMRGRVSQVDIAKQFGVSQSLISSIQTGTAWKHVR